MIILGSAIIMDFLYPLRRVIENMGSFQWEEVGVSELNPDVPFQ